MVLSGLPRRHWWRIPLAGVVVATLAWVTSIALPAAGAVFTGTTADSSTFASATLFPYSVRVLSDTPAFYHRFEETSGTVAADTSSNNSPGTYSPAVTTTGPFGLSSAISTGTAIGLDGTGYVSANSSVSGPTDLAMEVWVKTTTTLGGEIFGFGNQKTGNSTVVDRVLYLRNDGKVQFGVISGGVKKVLTSPGTVNDGNWHQIGVGLNGANGNTILGVDGTIVASLSPLGIPDAATGYWRVGGDALTGWANALTNNYLIGNVDEASVFPSWPAFLGLNSHYSARNSTYQSSITGESPAPSMYWRLDESTGATTATDTSGNGRTGTFHLGPAILAGQTGALGGSAAALHSVTLNGTTGIISNNATFTNPQTFTLEIWFKTTTTTGGALIGLDAGGGSSRVLWMGDNGKLNFGTNLGTASTITSTSAYNDGGWHLAEASLGGTYGMKLYVDGSSVAVNALRSSALTTNGVWDAGWDRLSGFTASTSLYFTGSLDEYAVYNTQLTDARIAAHWASRNT